MSSGSAPKAIGFGSGAGGVGGVGIAGIIGFGDWDGFIPPPAWVVGKFCGGWSIINFEINFKNYFLNNETNQAIILLYHEIFSGNAVSSKAAPATIPAADEFKAV